VEMGVGENVQYAEREILVGERKKKLHARAKIENKFFF